MKIHHQTTDFHYPVHTTCTRALGEKEESTKPVSTGNDIATPTLEAVAL
ncbi:MAG: hypothetical protein AAB426_00325 [Myxococcota bacterium]